MKNSKPPWLQNRSNTSDFSLHSQTKSELATKKKKTELVRGNEDWSESVSLFSEGAGVESPSQSERSGRWIGRQSVRNGVHRHWWTWRWSPKTEREREREREKGFGFGLWESMERRGNVLGLKLSLVHYSFVLQKHSHDEDLGKMT